MPGIYIHIPYCKVACHYCNFHFSTNTKTLQDFVKALLIEISLQKDYLSNETIQSIYFGGGTPSLLNAAEIEKILSALQQHFSIDANAEITLEANPDDITKEKLHEWKSLGINRFSLGTQSFFEEDLQWMNRAHAAHEAIHSIEIIQQADFSNINIDLIYGYPLLSIDKWQQNLNTFLQFNIPHLSSYCLTVEPKTALHKMMRQKEAMPIDDALSNQHFEMLMNFAQANGYEHYEISNFAKPNQYAKHNTAYWQGKKYIGFGPGAHSYNIASRQWNIANNNKYIKALLKESIIPFEIEYLTENNRFNEQLMTALRTQWGINIFDLKKQFSAQMITDFEVALMPYFMSKDLMKKENTILLTQKGKHIADKIISDLMIVD